MNLSVLSSPYKKNTETPVTAATVCMRWKWHKKYCRKLNRRKLHRPDSTIVAAKKHIDIQDEVLKRVGIVADRENIAAYVVGGYVRDILLGREVKDTDIVVIGSGVNCKKSRKGFWKNKSHSI